MKQIILIILIAILSSCNQEKRLAKWCAKCVIKTDSSYIKKDSSWVKETIVTKTITVSVPGPTIVLQGPCDSLCDKNGKIKSFSRTEKKNGITSKLFTDTIHNTLTQECNADAIKLAYQDTLRAYNRLIQVLKLKTMTMAPRCEKEHKDWLDKYDRPWFFISLGAFLLLIGWRLFKMKAALLKLFTTNPFK
jgi:hypothetical protein